MAMRKLKGTYSRHSVNSPLTPFCYIAIGLEKKQSPVYML